MACFQAGLRCLLDAGLDAPVRQMRGELSAGMERAKHELAATKLAAETAEAVRKAVAAENRARKEAEEAAAAAAEAKRKLERDAAAEAAAIAKSVALSVSGLQNAPYASTTA